MAEYKLTISDPKTGKSYQREVKDEQAKPLVGLKIGDKVTGDSFDLGGYEFEIRGGSDKSGFPMRSGIRSPRQRILVEKGVGCKGKEAGTKIKKTVCGHTVNANISQINLKVLKVGKTPLGGEEKKEEVLRSEASGTPEAKPLSAPKAEEKPQEEPKEEVKAKEEKTESKEEPEKKEEVKEEKSEEKPAEESEKKE